MHVVEEDAEMFLAVPERDDNGHTVACYAVMWSEPAAGLQLRMGQLHLPKGRSRHSHLHIAYCKTEKKGVCV